MSGFCKSRWSINELNTKCSWLPFEESYIDKPMRVNQVKLRYSPGSDLELLPGCRIPVFSILIFDIKKYSMEF